MSKKNNAQGDIRYTRPGRPTILESKGDPHLVEKAAEMRFLGCSWSQIASRLGVGKTTIRRYVLAFQKENGGQIEEEIGSRMPRNNDDDSRNKESQYLSFSIREDVLEGLPKTFRKFVSLVRKAREM